MKEKILLFVIGVLVGAIISTGAFYIYSTTNNNSNNGPQMQMPGGTPPEMPNGQQPPSMTNTNSTQSNS